MCAMVLGFKINLSQGMTLSILKSLMALLYGNQFSQHLIFKLKQNEFQNNFNDTVFIRFMQYEQ
jgi:hypothetical protein